MEPGVVAFRRFWRRQVDDRLSEIEKLEGAISALSDIISRLREEADLYESNVAALEKGRYEVTKHGLRIYTEEAPETKRFEGMKIADAAFQVLREAERPFHVREIWERISRGGIKSWAKKPTVSVAAALHRDERFENLGQNTFRIKGGTEQEFEV